MSFAGVDYFTLGVIVWLVSMLLVSVVGAIHAKFPDDYLDRDPEDEPVEYELIDDPNCPFCTSMKVSESETTSLYDCETTIINGCPVRSDCCRTVEVAVGRAWLRFQQDLDNEAEELEDGPMCEGCGYELDERVDVQFEGGFCNDCI